MSSKDKLRLVPGPKRQESKPPNTRFTIGNYIADLLVDPRSYATVYHWIVQRIGSAEILPGARKAVSRDAKQAARACLRNLAQNRALQIGH